MTWIIIHREKEIEKKTILNIQLRSRNYIDFFFLFLLIVRWEYWQSFEDLICYSQNIESHSRGSVIGRTLLSTPQISLAANKFNQLRVLGQPRSHEFTSGLTKQWYWSTSTPSIRASWWCTDSGQIQAPAQCSLWNCICHLPAEKPTNSRVVLLQVA